MHVFHISSIVLGKGSVKILTILLGATTVKGNEQINVTRSVIINGALFMQNEIDWYSKYF